MKAFPQTFSRGGVLTPEVLTAFLLFMVSNGNDRGISHVLLDFWEQAEDFGLDLPTDKPVSASAICQARGRLNPDLFRDLLYSLSNEACDEVGPLSGRRWRGRRVFAIDGAKINLRRSADHLHAFGVPDGAHSPQALMSQLVDVCTRTPIDFEFDEFRSSEREHALRMLDSLDTGDLLVLDRGHPSHEILQACVAADLDFLIRDPASNTSGVIDKFCESGEVDAMAVIKPPLDGDSE